MLIDDSTLATHFGYVQSSEGSNPGALLIETEIERQFGCYLNLMHAGFPKPKHG